VFEDTSDNFPKEPKIIFLNENSYDVDSENLPSLCKYLAKVTIKNPFPGKIVVVGMGAQQSPTDVTKPGMDILESMLTLMKKASPADGNSVLDEKPECFFYQHKQIKFVLVCKFKTRMKL
jgi:hypothetical protein